MIRDVNKIDDDIIRKKRIIATLIYGDPDIIEVIDNHDIDPACPEDAMYVNIFPFIRVPNTQDSSRSYITYMLDDIDTARSNAAMKIQYLKVVIFVHKDLVKTKYGAERHDLLSYLIKDNFHLSNMLGLKLELISDREGFAENDYCTRTLQFEMTTLNSIKPFQTNTYEYKSIVSRQDNTLQRESVGDVHG
jgi:hypothetical protein